MESILTDRLGILSHPQRMAVFRLLMRRTPDALPAGEITRVLALKPSTASVYLSALTSSGLIRQRRDGTRLMYSVNLDAAQDMIAGLFVDCCGGRADLCPPQFSPFVQGIRPASGPAYNVLFVCTGNSARSLMAETILRDMAGGRFSVYSAGTAPRTAAHPQAVALLRAKGHDVSPLRCKSLRAFQGPDAPKMDFVFTVCDGAANAECPAWPGQPVSCHWGLPDPALASGTDAQIALAFEQTYGALHSRLAAFTALPFDTLNGTTLQKHVDQIGRYKPTQDQII